MIVNMKKVLFAAALIFAVSSVLSSCKTHESCPAYGNHAQGDAVKTSEASI